MITANTDNWTHTPGRALALTTVSVPAPVEPMETGEGDDA